MIDFRTEPTQYKHWSLSFDGAVAYLTMDVDENAGLQPGYALKINSYDLGVDIELYDAVQRLRFEHPEVRCVVMRSGKDRIFCSGANIRMLGLSTHAHKVSFCKFTNETRNSIEDASAHSGQTYICAINGTAAGGGYELALATDYIMLVDDGNAAVSLPEVPLLAVLPGTGGLTRVVDKRQVRRDLADVFCTIEEGVRGERAVEWKLVDELVPSSKFESRVKEKALVFAEKSNRPKEVTGLELKPLVRDISENSASYKHIQCDIDQALSTVTIVLKAPSSAPQDGISQLLEQGCDYWSLALARELDDVLLHLRLNEPRLGTLIFRSSGDINHVIAYDEVLTQNQHHWLVREICHYWKRTLKRVDLTSRSIITLIDQESCFAGILAELVFAADRSYMLEGQLEGNDAPPAEIQLGAFNFDGLPMSNGLSRLETRFLGQADKIASLQKLTTQRMDALQAYAEGLVTFVPDELDWDDEIRLQLEERASFSPDAMTGMEANLRFAGPETMESKIFGRLTAWQNWIFQRPNASGEKGALKRYGTGTRAEYKKERV